VPLLEKYLKPDVIQKVQRLDLKARFIVEGFIAGLHESPFFGFSSEFSEHHKYNIGDDTRRIDWNVYGRTDKLYIKRFQAETSLRCYLVVDTSRSMAFSYGGVITKLEYATYMSAALGYIMIHQQDAVGLITFDDSIRNYLPAHSKRLQLVKLLAELARKPRGRKTNLAACLNQAAGMCRDKGLVIILSDLLPYGREVQEDIVRAIQHFRYKGHDVVMFHILDHAELLFPFDGPTRFIDVESNADVKVNSSAVRAEYLDNIKGFIEQYRQSCLRSRIDYILVDTHDSFDKVLVSYLLARKGRF